MTHTPAPLTFALDTGFDDLPHGAVAAARNNLLDLAGVGIAATATPLAGIIADFAAAEYAPRHPMLFDGRRTSAAGVALAGGMTIDALDGHDGYNPAKGHIGAALFPALAGLAMQHGDLDGRGFLAALTVGYELGSRMGPALHATVPDYHTSGAWMAVTVALVGGRVLGLDAATTAHAAGIAEYHGPRSQMMRCIDHPTMLKDGSGWGAMTGVAAVSLAASGFTGAPALNIAAPADIWDDLGQRWLTREQYYKPWPVCRWAHQAIEGALALRARHALSGDQIAGVEVETFHEATRLATALPRTTEEAQYSTSFPTAVALARGQVAPGDLTGDALRDPEVLRLSRAMVMRRSDRADAVFPQQRIARVTLTLHDGRRLQGDWTEARWEAADQPDAATLRAKFDNLAVPVIGQTRAAAVADAIATLESNGPGPLLRLLAQPISARTVSSRAS